MTREQICEMVASVFRDEYDAKVEVEVVSACLRFLEGITFLTDRSKRRVVVRIISETYFSATIQDSIERFHVTRSV